MTYPAPAAAPWPADAQERPPKRVKRTISNTSVTEKPEPEDKPRTIGTYVEVILNPIPSDP